MPFIRQEICRRQIKNLQSASALLAIGKFFIRKRKIGLRLSSLPAQPQAVKFWSIAPKLAGCTHAGLGVRPKPGSGPHSGKPASANSWIFIAGRTTIRFTDTQG